MTASLELHTEDHEDFRVLKVEGEVDMRSSVTLRDDLRKSLDGIPMLKVDLEAVRYLDSSGIAVLIQGFKWAKQKGVEYRLLNPSEQVRAVIELAMLQNFFVIETTGDDG